MCSLLLKSDARISQARQAVQAYRQMLETIDQLSWINLELLRRGFCRGNPLPRYETAPVRCLRSQSLSPAPVGRAHLRLPLPADHSCSASAGMSFFRVGAKILFLSRKRPRATPTTSKPKPTNARHSVPEQKIKILREHLLDKTPISAVCEQHQITPTQFYQWQKTFFGRQRPSPKPAMLAPTTSRATDHASSKTSSSARMRSYRDHGRAHHVKKSLGKAERELGCP